MGAGEAGRARLKSRARRHRRIRRGRRRREGRGEPHEEEPHGAGCREPGIGEAEGRVVGPTAGEPGTGTAGPTVGLTL